MPGRYSLDNDSYDDDPPRWWHKPLLILVLCVVGLVARRCQTGHW